ncbi:heparan-alpha-glucosaminide N-acetyltransferase domain-containing protein [Microbacterium sediminicola]|uniref:Heparan-alpha-glucosaminide N-acetyltransferase domain-containing protein n=1 Tax=Microbacterium sediminicola TaxID=415210 RepID=A0ABP4U0N6_9MICO
MAAAAGLADTLTTHVRRLDEPRRIAGIDLARGLAVIGMLAAHLFALGPLEWADPATWGSIASGRSSILFALAAGVSIALVTGGPRPLEGVARTVRSRWLARRALVLWMLGLLLIATGVPVYVILPAYALLFLMAIPFLGLRARALAAWAAGIALVVPWILPTTDALPIWDTLPGEAVWLFFGLAYPAPLWIAFVLAGMAIGRLDLRRPAALWALAVGGAALTVLSELLALVPVDAQSYLGQVWTTSPHSGGLLEVWGSCGFAVAVMALSILLCRTPVSAALLPIRATGSMPLTAYSAQIVIWAIWSFLALGTTTDLYGFRALQPFWPMVFGILIGCTLWALLRGRGPLERLVERFSAPRADRLGR